MLLYFLECFDDFYINLTSCLPSLTHTHTHTYTHTHTPAPPFCAKGYLTFLWASRFTTAWPSHRQVFEVFIENMWGRGILADESFKCSFVSQWKNRGAVGVDRKTNTVRKEEIIARGGKGRKRGIVFLDFDSFISCNVLSESLAPGGSCASSHSTCFERGFNFTCKCLLSRQGVPVQMKAPQYVSSSSLGLITSLQSLRELEM